MRKFIKKMVMMAVMALAMLFGFTPSVMAQAKGGKISAATRLIMAERDGKLSLEIPQDLRGKTIPTTFNPNGLESSSQESFDNALPVADPFTLDGVRMATCWINMTDHNYSALEQLGVKIQAKFANRVTAHIPIDQIENVAALSNVTKVAVARKLKSKTYRSRVMTNVDDVLNLSSDAQAAGLTQAYNGTGVVLGVIDTGIDFGHQMFSGRIKKKYVYNTTAEEVQEYTGSSYYYSDETHGTHTSTIAGGSDYTATAYVYTTGTSYTTVSNAKFGGMAPGTDLVLCDLGEELTDANIAACIKLISDYADQVGKPCVISLSLGGHFGPHDGTGDMADVCAQYTGPGKIIIFASGNEGEDGIYHYKSASSSAPAMTILSSQTRSSYSVDYGAALSYARTPNKELAARYYVVNTSTNSILWTSKEITTSDYFEDDEGNIEMYGAEISVNDTGSDGTTKLSNYFTAYNSDSDNYGYLCCYMDKDNHNNKWYVETVLYYLKAVSSNYKIGMSIYPKDGSTIIDSWPAAYIDFASSSASVNGNSFTAGGNNSSASDESSFPSVISVGAYCSSKYWYGGTTSGSRQYWTNNGTYQQISMFSSYQAEGYGPTGLKQPWITAPGEVIIAGYNSGYSVESNIYYAYGTNKKLGAMSGTSMAAPCAAGITALWLQVNPALTPEDVKNVMKETAIQDTYVTGTYASHFGQGKIDALAGVKYLLEHAGPTISATPATISFEGYATKSYTKTVSVKGLLLEGNITATLTDANGVYSIDKTTITQTDGTAQADITVTWSPATAGTQTATITLKSKNADDVVVSVSGTAKAADPFILAEPATLTFSAGLDTPDTQKFSVMSEFLTQDITVTLNDANGVFSVTPTTISRTASGEGEVEVTVTFSSSVEGTFTGSVVLSSAGASPVTISLSAEANDGGKATDAYLNIAKYATIGDAGWSTSNVNNLYKYTETTGGDAAWLTLPVYGAWVGCYYDSHPQKWIETDVTSTSNKYAGTTWSSSDVLLGSSPYFTSTTARAMGYNSRTNYTQETVTFYVTNTTAVKLLGLGQSRSSSSYPATLKVYECTRNADGTLTAGTTAVKSGSNSATSGTFVLSATDLDAGKIYKVEAATYRSYLCEIGFETPLSKPTLTAAPSSLEFSTTTGVPVTNTFTVKGSNLEEAVTATLTDANGVYSIDAGSISIADAEGGSGKDVTVTFSPTTDGTFTGTVTLGSGGSASATVTLSGVSTTPVLTATPTELTFARIEAESSSSQSFLLQGSNLVGDVTATLADASGVFSLDVTSVGASSAMEGRTVTVTFSPQAEGTYTGSVTLSSPHAADVVVPLSAEASRKFPDYYDLTMGNYGLSTMYLDFPVEIPYDTYDPDLLGVYIAYEIDMDSREVKLARLSRSIPANTGVIVHANSGTYRFPKATGDVDPLRYDNYFSGVTESTLVSKVLKDYSSSAYILTFQRGSDGYVGFYKYTGKRLSAYKAFIVYDPELFTMEVNGFSIAGFGAIGDDLTGIRDLDAVGQDGDWYTIQGMKLNGQPKQRGIYIHNGKTVQVK